MSNSGSVAPKERVNIVFQPSTGDAKEKVELPLKVLSVGEYGTKPQDTPIEKRNLIDVNSSNLDEVIDGMDLELDFSVSDKLSGKNGSDLSIKLNINKMKDFRPESIVEQVPQLKKVMDLRNALLSLKGPLGNIPALRKKIQSIVEDDDKRKQLAKEIQG